MAMHAQVDVAVIGGGVIGLSCAWRLAQAGATVRLFERDRIGSGASGASLGALIPATSTFHGPTQSFQRASLRCYSEFVAELKDATGINTGYARCTLLDLLHSEQRRENAIKESAVAVAEWPSPDGLPAMRVVENDEALSLEPTANFDAHGVRYCRLSAQVDIARLLDALQAACEQSGVSIQEFSPVTEIVVEKERVVGLRCGEQRLEAGTVVAAAGAWGPSISPLLARYAAVRPVKGQALLLDAGSINLTHIIKRRRAYVLPGAEGHVLVGSTTEPEAGFDVRTTARGVADLTAGALGLVPTLADARVVRMWAGLRPESLQHRPFIGPVPEAEGLYVATGHYKTGIAMAPLTGKVVADLIARGHGEIDLAPFAPESSAAT